MTKPTSSPLPGGIRAAVALVVAAAFVLTGCSTGTSGTPQKTVSVTSSQGSSSDPASTGSSSAPSAPPAKPVHIGLQFGDGAERGVGMPIIATFSKKVTDGRDFAKATKVTVNGAPVNGAWYFEYTDPKSGHVMEAHYRLAHYWPAHAQIHMELPVKGVSAGSGLAFDDSLTLDWSTGAANIVTVDDSSHTLQVTTDGKPWGGTFHVSLGARDTPTLRGTKVIMEKLQSVCMSGHPPNGPSYHECGVKWDQRLTYGGEYLHAAPWNTHNILTGTDSSNGCTNLQTPDAEKLYNFLNVGDVVLYPNANGPHMSIGDGFGDWNVPWAQWQTGGAVPTH